MKTISALKFSSILLAACLISTSAISQEKEKKEQEKIQDCVRTLKDFSRIKENIPELLLKNNQGMIIVPKMINAGLVVGGKRGKGIAVVKNENGVWSNPVFVTLTGGSIGLQAGVQSVDLVLVFKSRETLRNIGNGSFTLGGDISVSAGPFGRSSTANTDYKLEAEVYSYSRSRGLFAGITLNGVVLDVDQDANSVYYGKKIEAKTLFAETSTKSSSSVQLLKETLASLDQ